MNLVLSVLALLLTVIFYSFVLYCFLVGVTSVYTRVSQRVKEKLHHGKTE